MLANRVMMGSWRKAEDAGLPVTDGLLGWWKFDDGAGQVLTDYSGNGNHGQLGSATGVDTNDPTWTSQGLQFSGNNFVGLNIDLDAPVSTIIMVVSTTDISAQQRLSSGTDNVWYAYSGLGIEYENYVIAYMANGTNKTLLLGDAVANEYRCLACMINVSSVVGWNGNTKYSVQETALDAYNFWGLYFFGKSSYSELPSCFKGNIATALYYDHPLSDAEYNLVYEALQKEMTARGVTI